MSSRERLIRQLSAKYGLDPDAVVAIASVEGQRALHGGNSIGDHGTSFGPFQEHIGGALPKGKGNAWANSPAGLEHAISHMAPYAKGLHGEAAVAAISGKFERPADVRGEIQKAMGYYGNVGNPGGALPGGHAPSVATDALSTQAFKSMAAATMLDQSVATLHGQQSDPSGLMALAIARQQFQAAHQTYGPTPQAKGSLVAPKSGINELFYDPLGGIKYGKQIGAIGGHKDHVHMSLGTEAAQKAAIAQAQRMGLHVGEDMDGNVHPVHVGTSFHYQHYAKGDPLRKAADVAGTPSQMASFYHWVSSNFG